LLGHEYVWYLVATQASELLGHVGFLPANRLQFAPSDDPGLVHFRQLFVVRAHWGTGLAATLHAAAVQEATARGFTSMRLFTPADQGGPAASTSARAGRSRGRRPSRSASASTSPSTAARYSSSPRRIASATAAARSLTPSFS
jgi:GNAT superfamily N-acetyltransferase